MTDLTEVTKITEIDRDIVSHRPNKTHFNILPYAIIFACLVRKYFLSIKLLLLFLFLQLIGVLCQIPNTLLS